MATITGDPPVLHLSLVEWSALQRIDHACGVLKEVGEQPPAVARRWIAAVVALVGPTIARELAGREFTVVCDELVEAGVSTAGHVLH